MIDAIFVLPLITAALYHLGARAVITQAIHSRYPAWLAGFMNCAACSGTWYGFACGTIGLIAGVPFLGSTAIWTPLVVALMSMVWTPIVAAVHERAMHELNYGIQTLRVFHSEERRDDP